MGRCAAAQRVALGPVEPGVAGRGVEQPRPLRRRDVQRREVVVQATAATETVPSQPSFVGMAGGPAQPDQQAGAGAFGLHQIRLAAGEAVVAVEAHQLATPGVVEHPVGTAGVAVGHLGGGERVAQEAADAHGLVQIAAGAVELYGPEHVRVLHRGQIAAGHVAGHEIQEPVVVARLDGAADQRLTAVALVLDGQEFRRLDRRRDQTEDQTQTQVDRFHTAHPATARGNRLAAGFV
ncbi:MAG: hypothetical protein CMD39_03360 [Gammaproteobacteria bacterium]|nr:hypothetical protein [Gammaproteobacteria bacterium]